MRRTGLMIATLFAAGGLAAAAWAVSGLCGWLAQRTGNGGCIASHPLPDIAPSRDTMQIDAAGRLVIVGQCYRAGMPSGSVDSLITFVVLAPDTRTGATLSDIETSAGYGIRALPGWSADGRFL